MTSCISGRSMSKRLSIIFKRGQEAKSSKTNYSPQGYWHQKARRRGKVSDDAAKKWLIKQVIWQINLSAAKHIPHPKFDTPGRGRRRKTYKSDLTVVDVDSCFKEAELLTWKDC